MVFMSSRQKKVHPTAQPLFDCLNSHAFTRAEAAKHFSIDPQNITNWLSRGVPARRISEVAELCGISTDEYRFRAGLTSKSPANQPPDLGADGLPDYLRSYLRRKVATMQAHYDAVPEWLRDKLAPPTDRAVYPDWEQRIEGLLMSFADGTPRTLTKRKQKVSAR